MTDIDDLKKYRFCLNLGRYLMAHNPQLAEYQLHMLKKTLNLGDEVKKGNWIITNDFGGGKQYIIVKDGQPLSTDSIPEWATNYPRKYVVADADANLKECLMLLQNILDKFGEGYQPLKTYLSDYISTVAKYYENSMVSVAETVEIVDLCNSTLAYSGSYSDLLLQGQQKIISNYNAVKIPEDAAIMPLCITVFLRRFQNRQMERDLHNTITTFIKHPEQNFLLNQEAAVRTVQSLYHTANTLKDAAQNEYTFFLFYKDIYEALLFYRSALYMGTLLINHEIDNSDLRHIVYMSEEMRVIILASIMPICRNKRPDFLSPEDIFVWLGVIKDKKVQNSNLCLSDVHMIHEHYVSLCYPRLYRDVALEVYKTSRKITTSIKKLEKYIQCLEEKRELLIDEVYVIDYLRSYVKNSYVC